MKCIKESAKFFAIGAKDRCNKMKKVIRVAWEKPPLGWMKLNNDGSALGNPGKAGGGGLIRDHQGNWVRGFARAHGNTSSSITELWALRDGLEIAKDLGLNNLIVEMDALSIVLLMNNTKANLLMEPLLFDCRKLLAAIPNKRVVHTFCEANQCADILARFGGSSISNFGVFLNPPSVVADILLADKETSYCNRLVPA